jgi:hypothetical protein
MARVLAAGGFPEEAPPLLAKALGFAGAAKLSVLGGLPPGSANITPAQIQDLVGRGALPAHTTATAAALWSTTSPADGGEVDDLLEQTAAVLASCSEGAAATAALQWH